jgi:hypothetical protein
MLIHGTERRSEKGENIQLCPVAALRFKSICEVNALCVG